MSRFCGEPYIEPTADGGAITINAGTPAMDCTLRDAVYISLFTAPDFWGNELLPVKIGCELDSIETYPLTNATRLNACEYAKNALKWMIDEGYAKSVDAEAIISSINTILIRVTITEPDGTTDNMEYLAYWDNIKNILLEAE